MKKYFYIAFIITSLVIPVSTRADVPSSANYWQAHGKNVSPLNGYSVTLGNATSTNFVITGTCTGCGSGGSATNTINGVLGPNFTFGTQSSGTSFSYSTSTGTVTLNTPTNLLTTARNINTTAPLQGGGALSTDLTLSIPQASSTGSGYLSSTDWSTFNGKQAAISLTTTGTSGAASFSSNVLNVPQYQAALTNP